MTILALETSAARCQVALLDGSTLHVVEEREAQHSRVVLALVEKLLEEAGCALSGLQAIAVSHGPGSFTGLRIGIAVAQGLAYASNLPVVPIGTLAALAYQAEHESRVSRGDSPLHVLATIDARKEQIYYAWFECSENSVQMLGTQSLDDPAKLAQQAVPDGYSKGYSNGQQPLQTAVGTGLRYADSLPGWVQPYCIEPASS
ncbi:MAG: tRNA (adenosine(37)-N6)-threonylcarbamoyltransferase complex dimerization subunit type 1 TsaB, partial [Pseudomonadales bacterium]|nr:tRNA (adenosine(37)-N6)-threonylcarbamoyltransferase complex dimerization subunit type 1 TsaB [Pseudomonadales bacterium]